MRRRSRTRRVLKWLGLLGCAVPAGAIVVSLRWEFFVFGDRWAVPVLDGSSFLG
jgi:hypothetical protein